jgi:hypothetical protein
MEKAIIHHCSNAARWKMRESSNDTGGDGQVRLTGPIFLSVENWRRSQSKIPSRSEAIRQLLEKALGQSQKAAGA